MTFERVSRLYRQPSNKSESSSSQATTSTTENQQVAADNGGIAIGAGASYVNEFDPNVASAVTAVIDKAFNFAQGVAATAGSIAGGAVSGEQAATAAALQTANQSINNAQLGQSAIFTNPAFIGGGLALIALLIYSLNKWR